MTSFLSPKSPQPGFNLPDLSYSLVHLVNLTIQLSFDFLQNLILLSVQDWVLQTERFHLCLTLLVLFFRQLDLLLKLLNLSFLPPDPLFSLSVIIFLVNPCHLTRTYIVAISSGIEVCQHIRNPFSICILAPLTKVIKHCFDFVHFLLQTVHVMVIGCG